MVAPYVQGVKYAFGKTGPDCIPGNFGCARGGDLLPQAYDWLVAELRSGKAQAVVAQESRVHMWAVSNCGSFAVANSIALAEYQWFLMFKPEDQHLANGTLLCATLPHPALPCKGVLTQPNATI